MNRRDIIKMAIGGALLTVLPTVQASEGNPPILYNGEDGGHIIGYKPSNKVIVFFHGGGWTVGDTNQFKEYAEYYSKEMGCTCYLVGYLLSDRKTVFIDDIIKDCKLALDKIRTLNPNSEIYLVGGSAGGYLAAYVGTQFEEKVKGMVLFNPALDLSDIPYSYHNIFYNNPHLYTLTNDTNPWPETLIIHGAADKVVPIGPINQFRKRKENVTLVTVWGVGHGWFNGDVAKNIEYMDRVIFHKKVAYTY